MSSITAITASASTIVGRAASRHPRAVPRQARSTESFDWMLYELDYAWREDHAEAELAYHAWSVGSGRNRYAVYRAAEDRADAAQDALAVWVLGRQLIN